MGKAATAETLRCAALLIADNAGVDLSPPGLGDAEARIPVAMVPHEDGAALLTDAAQQVQVRMEVVGGRTDGDSAGVRSSTSADSVGGIGPASDGSSTLGERPQDMIRYRRKASLGLTSLQRHCVERFAASPRLRPVRRRQPSSACQAPARASLASRRGNSVRHCLCVWA